jgi:hypothetical protein
MIIGFFVGMGRNNCSWLVLCVFVKRGSDNEIISKCLFRALGSGLFGGGLL